MKKLARNILSLSLSDIARKILGFISVAYLTRHISVSDFGIVSIAMTILSYLLIFGAAGLPSYGTRSTAQGQSAGIVGEILGVRLINAVILVVLANILALSFFHDTSLRLLTMVFTFSAIPNALLLDWYFQGRESMAIIGIARIASAICYLTIITGAVHTSNDVVWVAIAAIIGDVISVIIMLTAYVKNGNHIQLKVTFSTWIRLMKLSLPFGSGTILAQCAVNIATIIIGIALTTYDAGIFSAANKFVIFLLMFDRVLATVLLPAAARIYNETPGDFPRKILEAFEWTLLIALPVCTGGMMVSEKLLVYVFGAEYAPAVVTFQVLIWFLLFTMLHSVFSYALIGIGKEKKFAQVMLFGAILYVLCVSLGILTFGLPGVALGMVFAEGFSVLLMKYQFNRYVKLPLSLKAVKIIASVFIMAVGLIFMPPLHLFFMIGIGGVLYITSLFVTRALKVNDIVLLLERIR